MDIKQKVAPNLYKIIDTIESDRVKIADEWMKVETVADIFKKYKISINKFKEKFAVKIIEYFISVVREEKEAGDCPIMTKFVNYMIDKNITPRQVFQICMGVRKALRVYIFNKDFTLEETQGILTETADLFDANLAGVLDIFTSLYEKQQQLIVESRERQNKFQEFSKIINFIHSKIIIVKDGKIVTANKSFFEFTGTSNLDEFYEVLKYEQIKHEKDSKEKFTLSNIDDWLEDACKKDNSFNVDVYHQKYQKLFTYNARVTELPGKEVKYIISFNNISNFIGDNEKLKMSLEKDKLTGLYNYVKFESLLGNSRIQNQDGKKSALAVIDLPDLKTLNAKGETKQCSDIIVQTANKIKDFVSKDIQVARVQDCRFALYIPMNTKQSCYDWCFSLFSKLNQEKHRVTFALSWFDTSEDENVSLLNVFSLIEKANKSIKKKIFTDFEGIRESELLEDQEKFVSAIDKLKKVNMIIYYKELPIVSKNTLLHKDSKSVSFHISKKQCVTIREDSKVYFHLENIGDVEAEIKDFDVVKNEMAIHNFRVAKSSPIHRTMFRVRAEEQDVKIIPEDDDIIYSTLLDLNIKSMAVSMKRKYDISVGDKIQIKTVLSIDKKPNNIKALGEVIKIEKNKQNKKVVIECKYDSQTEKAISSYISIRQMQIVKEIQCVDT
ncbi:diguanylate cyclase [Sulfurimonas lithotrophica]|uniref:Diguanylate cyclase n=1 Tax=Sulfurimonas lithotrophica TaxID=2590022 RepID=A0A5P8NYP3_9BACT|nr:diguanylate cyclase [Sulfurimonas lithotrophica]QFR48552.1 diguanylate cyclase [Sulfurimonas lithotrophica]